jgi:dihydroxyacetone kinase
MSEAIGSAGVVAALRRVGAILVEREAYLTELDQQMGDGDLGITLSKIGAALVEFADSTPVDGDLGKYLGKAGAAANRAGSSSFGTLLATAFMRAGKTIGAKDEVTAAELAAMFAAADTGVQERGKAQLGDKTVVDALHPASATFGAALQAGQSLREAGLAALAAAEAGRDAVTPLRSKIGRASWVGERTEGKVDAGCEALVVMLGAVLEG